MLKRYTFWLTAAVIFQFLTAAFHAINLFVTPGSANHTERQLVTLLTTYKIDAGGGFQLTFGKLFYCIKLVF